MVSTSFVVAEMAELFLLLRLSKGLGIIQTRLLKQRTTKGMMYTRMEVWKESTGPGSTPNALPWQNDDIELVVHTLLIFNFVVFAVPLADERPALAFKTRTVPCAIR